jgi:hypothetical protein
MFYLIILINDETVENAKKKGELFGSRYTNSAIDDYFKVWKLWRKFLMMKIPMWTNMILAIGLLNNNLDKQRSTNIT